MKKAVLILSFILVSVVSFAQRQRTTAMFDADTTTRPSSGFYGLGFRSNRLFAIPNTGTNIRLLSANSHVGSNGQFLFTNGTSNIWRTPLKSDVGLGNVDNTTDLNKPISTATQSALDLKANLFGPTFTGTVTLPSTTSIGTVSSTEIGYLDGVTSSIQTQISGKFATPIGLTTNYVTKWNGTANGLENTQIFDNGTNVGIGTATPTQKLHVNGNTRLGERVEMQPSRRIGAGLDFGNVIEAGSGYLEFYNSGTGNTSLVNTTEFAAITLHTNDTERFRILANGNVGINTTSPTQKLDVNGTTQATAFRLSANNTAPSSSTATCTTGEIRIDGNYIYYCSGTNTWKRATLNTY